MKHFVSPQGQSLISMIDFAGQPLTVGTIIIAPLEDKLQAGVVAEIHSAPGTLTAELYSETFTVPVRQLYLFPTTQVVAIPDSCVPNAVRTNLLARSEELCDADRRAVAAPEVATRPGTERS